MTTLWPFVVIGLFSGSVYALAAMGVVLTYRTSGVFNFAYGAVAMFCGFTLWQLRDGWHLTSWVSLPVVLLVVAPAIGLMCERLFRPVTELPTEIQIVVSLGVLAFLQAAAPLLYGSKVRALPGIFPDGTFRLGTRLYVSYEQLGTLTLALGLGAGLWLLLRHSRLGTATGAVVDNRELAQLAGVSTAAVSRTAWVISSVFAALVGILLSSSQGLDTYALVVVVIFAFAPAVLGKLSSLPLAFAGAMALGITQSVLGRWGSSGTVANVQASIPYAALFAVLVVYGRRLREVKASYHQIATAGPTVAGDRDAHRSLRTGAAVLGAAAALPLVLSGSQLRDAAAGLVFAIVALTVVVLTGWAGQISLAQFSFAGVGAFTAGHLAGASGGHFLPAVIAGMAIAIPVGLVVGLPSLRLSGLYLALATMAFALMLDNLVFIRRSITGGVTGMAVPRPHVGPLSFSSTTSFYFLVLGAFAALAAAAAWLKAGWVGRRLEMMRDAPVAAATFGVNLTRTKLAVFAACAAVAALGGALFGSLRLTVGPSDFSFAASLQVLLLVVLGGRLLVGGALLAGAIYSFELLPLAPGVQRLIPLAVAVGVVFLARHPEGPIPLVAAWGRREAALFTPLAPVDGAPLEGRADA